MMPTFLSAIHRLVSAKVPHAHEVLDALNPRGRLRVVDLKLDRPSPSMLQIELCVTGLDPIEAERWATQQKPLLRVHAPLRRGRAGTLWFGQAQFEQAPPAYVRLELPFAALRNPNERDSFVTLTTCSDAPMLEAWVKNACAQLAANTVQRIANPIVLQADQFGFEAIALGLRAAMRRLEPEKAAGLLGCVAPVLFTGWLEAWAEALALSAPGLKRVEAELVAEPSADDALRWQPMVERLRLVGAVSEPVCVSPRQDERDWEEDDQAAVLARLRAVTGAKLETPASVVSFLEEVAALLLLQYRANGATEIEMPNATTTPPGPDTTVH